MSFSKRNSMRMKRVERIKIRAAANAAEETKTHTAEANGTVDFRRERLLAAYRLLDTVTPKRCDCGLLCGGACCKENASHGADEDSACGMLLLPGEKELLTDFEPNVQIQKTEEGDLLICGGICDRAHRPFACRIFPFYPHFAVRGDNSFRIEILPDPRGALICPILHDRRKRKAQISFLRNAKRAVRILCADPDILRELDQQSEMISDIAALRAKLFSER